MSDELGTFFGKGLSRDDEFFSNPSEGKLAFTSPSVMDLFKADFSDFNGEGILPPGNDKHIKFYTVAVNTDHPDREI